MKEHIVTVVTTKNNIQYKIGIKEKQDFEVIKGKIINAGNNEFIEILETCFILKSEILSIEMYKVSEEAQDEN